MGAPFSTSTVGLKDYDNLWAGDLSIDNNGDGNINQTTDKWVATTSASAISGHAYAHNQSGYLDVRSRGNSSDSGSSNVRTAYSLKLYSKFQFSFSACVRNGTGISGEVRVRLTDGGSNNLDILDFITGTSAGSVGGGGNVRLVYDGTNVNIQHTIVFEGYLAATSTLLSSGTNQNVSTWTNVYIEFYSQSGASSTQSVDSAITVSNILICDYFPNSNKTQ